MPTIQWYKNDILIPQESSKLYLASTDTPGTTVYSCKGRNKAGNIENTASENITVTVKSMYIWMHSKAKLPPQNSKWTWTAPYFCMKFLSFICLSHDDTTWYHHDSDRHKNGIFMEKYGAIQIHFDKVVLLCNT